MMGNMITAVVPRPPLNERSLHAEETNAESSFDQADPADQVSKRHGRRRSDVLALLQAASNACLTDRAILAPAVVVLRLSHSVPSLVSTAAFDGRDLASVLEDRRQDAETVGVRPTRIPVCCLEEINQLAAALQFLHRLGVMHGALSAKAVKFGCDGRLLLTELDRAHTVDGLSDITSRGLVEDDRPGLTDEAMTHAAPEILRHGSTRPGLSADVYSFALVTWSMLTFLPPFEEYANERETLITRICDDYVRPPLQDRFSVSWTDSSPDKLPEYCPELNESLCDMLEESWDEDPTVRYNMGEILQILKQEIRSTKRALQSSAIQLGSTSNTKSSSNLDNTLRQKEIS